jgi:hypothetical protein
LRAITPPVIALAAWNTDDIIAFLMPHKLNDFVW